MGFFSYSGYMKNIRWHIKIRFNLYISFCRFLADENRTVCVNKFRDKLFQLKEDQYMNYVASVLRRNCTTNDTLCTDERYLFIDIVSRAGDAKSQRLTIKYVFHSARHDEEELRRALFHFATLSDPIKVLMKIRYEI